MLTIYIGFAVFVIITYFTTNADCGPISPALTRCILICTIWGIAFIIKWVIFTITYCFVYPSIYKKIKRSKPNSKAAQSFMVFLRYATMGRTGDFVPDTTV